VNSGQSAQKGTVDYDRFVLLQAEALLKANHNNYASLNDLSAFGAALAAADESNDRHDAEFHR
jgi:hypothetical protein